MNRTLATSQRGFTLIELSIVLLIGILGFAALGSRIGSGNQTAQLQAASRDLASALRYARGQALILDKTVSVAISLSDNRYQVSSREKIHQLPEKLTISLTIAEDEFEDDETGHIRFFSDGSSTGGRITLESEQQQRQIDVNWITGAVAISEPSVK